MNGEQCKLRYISCLLLNQELIFQQLIYPDDEDSADVQKWKKCVCACRRKQCKCRR